LRIETIGAVGRVAAIFTRNHLLRQIAQEPDPLQPFAAAMVSLHSQHGERSTVCLDLLPAAGRRRTRLRRRPFWVFLDEVQSSHLLATALNSHAAALLTKEWAGQPNPAALTKLGRHRFVAQVTHCGELSKPFALGGIRVEDILGPPTARGDALIDGALPGARPRHPLG
jgi:hypothetical protein